MIYSSIAQLVEHAAVNRRVVGSSPTWGATGVNLLTHEPSRNSAAATLKLPYISYIRIYKGL
jgi:hypothetical protein